MSLRITIELIPFGDEKRKRKIAIIDVINDGTGTSLIGNYRIDAEGECSAGGEGVGWDNFEGFPRTLSCVERRRGYLNLAAEAMQFFNAK